MFTVQNHPSHNYDKYYGTGALISLAGVVALVIWIWQGEMSEAALGVGVLEPKGGSVLIQHSTGGEIAEVLVYEGDMVNVGDILMRLSDHQVKAEINRIENRLLKMESALYRLELEAGSQDWAVVAPFDAPKYRDAIWLQKRLYDTRQLTYQVQGEILHSKILEYKREISGLKQQLDASKRQRDIVRGRLKGLRSLVLKGMISRTEELNLLATEAELDGEVGSFSSSIFRVRQRIKEAQLRIQMLDRTRQADLSEEITDQQIVVADLKDRLTAERIKLDATELTAQASGLITELKYKNPGEVVRPGDTVMKLVPKGQQFVVRGQISPDDIDLLKTGQKVDVHLSAWSKRRNLPIPGILEHVSADRIKTDGEKGFYEVRIALNQKSLERLSASLYPGMQADLTLLGEARPIWRYLLDPMLGSIDRSLREH
ncbi:MAG: HlyD family type I secretion periplasmic adaptor subunit [Pontibacterium sp.]